MKTKIPPLFQSLVWLGLVSIVCLSAGCGTTAKKEKDKPTYARGWIGGQVMTVRCFPKTLIPRPKAAILLTALATNTPAAAAGLQAGDLILALHHQPMEKLKDFRRRLDRLKPGASLPVTAYHDGQIVDFNIVVGSETYRNGGAFTLYFPCIAQHWNFWPHGDYPGFSLVALGYQVNNVSRVELGSADQEYYRKCDPETHPYDEKYKFWLANMEFSKGKHIIGQQMADAVK